MVVAGTRPDPSIGIVILSLFFLRQWGWKWLWSPSLLLKRREQKCVVDAAGLIGLCLSTSQIFVDSWTRKSQSPFPSVLLRAATVSQVSRLNLVFVRDFFNWSSRYRFGFPHSHLPLASSPNRTIRGSWEDAFWTFGPMLKDGSLGAGEKHPREDTLVMRSSLLMRSIFWNFVSWNHARCLISLS